MAFEGEIQNYAPAEVDEVGQIILKARELLSDPKRWTQIYLGRDAQDGPCAANNPLAVKWCIVGAVEKITGLSNTEFPDVIDRLYGALPPSRVRNLTPPVTADGRTFRVTTFNDDLQHADALALLDRAAKGGQP